MGIKQNYTNLPKSTKKLLSVGIILALVVALPLFVWSVINLNFNSKENAQLNTSNINLENQPYLGYSDSPVTIVMYSDFQCEFCKSFVDNTLSTILSNYPNEVRFVHKDFPLTTLHPLALDAAKAGQCAFEQNKFWEMHSLIFQNQSTLNSNSFAQFAASLGLDSVQFESCMSSQETINKINEDIAEGNNLAISGTPTFFINDQKLSGALPFEDFKTVINEKLTDDFRFTGVTYQIKDTTSNTQLNVSDLTLGNTYKLDINFDLQNNLKYQHASTSAVPVVLTVNNVYKGDNNPKYIDIAGNLDGYNGTITTQFVASNSNELKLTVDFNNLYSEYNENNNEYVTSFYLGATPTATSTSTTSTPTSTATSTVSASPTASATVTATATPTSVPEEPNSCGGTCGSNYNCKANLYCYQGYCRNPICSSDNDCDCIIKTSTPTSTAKASVTSSTVSNKATQTSKTSNTPKATPNYTGGMTLIEKPEELKRDNEPEQQNQLENMFINKYGLYIVAGFGLIVLSVIIYIFKKKRDNNIPHIVPPTNI